MRELPKTELRLHLDCTLSYEEYERLAATFGWSERHFLARNLDAVEASFTGAPPAGERGTPDQPLG